MPLGESLCLATPAIIAAGLRLLFIGRRGRSAVRAFINQAPAVLVGARAVREHYGGVRARRILLDIASRILSGGKVHERVGFKSSSSVRPGL